MASTNINQADNTNQIGALATTFGQVVNDAQFTRANGQIGIPIYLRIGVGAPDVVGDLVIEDQDGVVDVIRAVATGEVIPLAKCRRVLSSATINSVLYTTTCTNITWFGGSR